MKQIPDHPMIRQIEKYGYPEWMVEEEDEEEEDDDDGE